MNLTFSKNSVFFLFFVLVLAGCKYDQRDVDFRGTDTADSFTGDVYLRSRLLRGKCDIEVRVNNASGPAMRFTVTTPKNGESRFDQKKSGCTISGEKYLRGEYRESSGPIQHEEYFTDCTIDGQYSNRLKKRVMRDFYQVTSSVLAEVVRNSDDVTLFTVESAVTPRTVIHRVSESDCRDDW